MNVVRRDQQKKKDWNLHLINKIFKLNDKFVGRLLLILVQYFGGSRFLHDKSGITYIFSLIILKGFFEALLESLFCMYSMLSCSYIIACYGYPVKYEFWLHHYPDFDANVI